jgi:hypothetical protein
MVIVDHPLGGALADEIRQRADDARKLVADLIAAAR